MVAVGKRAWTDSGRSRQIGRRCPQQTGERQWIPLTFVGKLDLLRAKVGDGAAVGLRGYQLDGTEDLGWLGFRALSRDLKLPPRSPKNEKTAGNSGSHFHLLKVRPS